jgi:hypothetical protein
MRHIFNEWKINLENKEHTQLSPALFAAECIDVLGVLEDGKCGTKIMISA